MSQDKQDRVVELLETLVKLQMKPIIQSEVIDKNLTELYKLTGSKKITEISKKIGMSTGKISAIWQGWESVGLLKKDGKGYKKVI